MPRTVALEGIQHDGGSSTLIDGGLTYPRGPERYFCTGLCRALAELVKFFRAVDGPVVALEVRALSLARVLVALGESLTSLFRPTDQPAKRHE